jgi:hypothetical protein
MTWRGRKLSRPFRDDSHDPIARRTTLGTNRWTFPHGMEGGRFGDVETMSAPKSERQQHRDPLVIGMRSVKWHY